MKSLPPSAAQTGRTVFPSFTLGHQQLQQTKLRLQLPSSVDNAAHAAAPPCANLTAERGNRTCLPTVFVLDECI